MLTAVLLVLGWCCLSLPLGIVVGRLLRGSAPERHRQGLIPSFTTRGPSRV